jgi:hypothetical protein
MAAHLRRHNVDVVFVIVVGGAAPDGLRGEAARSLDNNFLMLHNQYIMVRVV